MPYIQLDLAFTKGPEEVILRDTLAWASPLGRPRQSLGSVALTPNPQLRDTWNSDTGNVLQSNRPFLLISHKLGIAKHKRPEGK